MSHLSQREKKKGNPGLRNEYRYEGESCEKKKRNQFGASSHVIEGAGSGEKKRLVIEEKKKKKEPPFPTNRSKYMLLRGQQKDPSRERETEPNSK